MPENDWFIAADDARRHVGLRPRLPRGAEGPVVKRDTMRTEFPQHVVSFHGCTGVMEDASVSSASFARRPATSTARDSRAESCASTEGTPIS